MTARTAVVAGLVKLARDAGTALGAGQAPDAANGNTLPAPGPYKAKIIIHNADSAPHTCTVRATGSGVDATGAAQTNPAPSNVVFEQGTVGDLVVSVAATSYTVIKLSTTDRFMQADGSLSIDWSSLTSMTFWVIVDPYVQPS